MSKALTYIVDRIVQAILRLEDYFYGHTKVTVSEGVLLILAATHAGWFLFFEVSRSAPFYRYILSEFLWAALFSFAAGVHLIGIVKNSVRIRFHAARSYAILWFVWFIIIGLPHYSNPVAPRVALFTILAGIVAVKLGREIPTAK